MRVAVFGYGSMGRRHAVNARDLGHDVIVRETDREKRYAANRDGFVAEDLPANDSNLSISEMGAAIIASPASTHATLLGLCAAFNVPTLVEKPIARSIRELENVALPEILEVGYNLLHHPGLARLKQLIAEEEMLVTYSHFVLRSHKGGWPGAHYADMLLEGSHEIAVALWLLGPAVCVGAVGEGDQWHLMLRHENGGSSSITLDGVCAPDLQDRMIQLYTPVNVAMFGWNKGIGWKWNIVNLRGGPSEIMATGACTPEETYKIELERFFQRIAGGPSTCDIAQALEVLHICDSARRLARFSESVTR